MRWKERQAIILNRKRLERSNLAPASPDSVADRATLAGLILQLKTTLSNLKFRFSGLVGQSRSKMAGTRNVPSDIGLARATFPARGPGQWNSFGVLMAVVMGWVGFAMNLLRESKQRRDHGVLLIRYGSIGIGP